MLRDVSGAAAVSFVATIVRGTREQCFVRLGVESIGLSGVLRISSA